METRVAANPLPAVCAKTGVFMYALTSAFCLVLAEHYQDTPRGWRSDANGNMFSINSLWAFIGPLATKLNYRPLLQNRPDADRNSATSDLFTLAAPHIGSNAVMATLISTGALAAPVIAVLSGGAGFAIAAYVHRDQLVPAVSSALNQAKHALSSCSLFKRCFGANEEAKNLNDRDLLLRPAPSVRP